MPVDRKKMAEYLSSPAYQRMAPEQQERIKSRLRTELGQGAEGPKVSGPPTGMNAVKSKGYEYLERFTNQLPNIGGAVGGIGGTAAATEAGPFAPIVGVAGAGVGGEVGARGRDAVRRRLGWEVKPGDPQSEGMEQAGYEALGGAAGIPFRTAGRYLRSPAMKAMQSSLKEAGIQPTIADSIRSIPGQYVRREMEKLPVSKEVADMMTAKRLGKITAKAGESVASNAPKIAEETGKDIQHSIIDINAPIYKDQVRTLSDDVSLIMGKQPVDISPLKLKVQQMLTDEVAPLAQVAPETGAMSSGRKAIFEDILHAPEKVPFDVLRSWRTKLMGVGPQTTELLSGEAKGTAKLFIGMMTKALDDAANQQGGRPGRDAWKAFRDFTREGGKVFDSKYIASTLAKDPEKIAESIGLGDITNTRKLYDAAQRYADQYSQNPVEKEAAAKAWNNFQRQWTLTNILKDAQGSGTFDVRHLSKNLREAGDAQLGVIYGSSPEGRIALNNLRNLAKVMDSIHLPASSEVERSIVWAIPGAVVSPLTYIMFSPTMGRVYNAIWKRIPERPGAAAGLIRLYDAANKDKETRDEQERNRKERQNLVNSGFNKTSNVRSEAQ
jgi:hypothetical protein